MTIQQAITTAMKYFDKKMPYASIRRVSLSEASGDWRTGRLSTALIHIEYAILENYTESDEHPLYVRVDLAAGKAKASYIISR